MAVLAEDIANAVFGLAQLELAAGASVRARPSFVQLGHPMTASAQGVGTDFEHGVQSRA